MDAKTSTALHPGWIFPGQIPFLQRLRAGNFMKDFNKPADPSDAETLGKPRRQSADKMLDSRISKLKREKVRHAAETLIE